MPSSTPKQKKTMAAAAHNPVFAKKVGIPVGVAKKFNAADQGRPEPTTFHRGGMVKAGSPAVTYPHIECKVTHCS